MILDIRDMNEFVPYYTPEAKALKWKKSKTQKKYPVIETRDIIVTQKDKQKFEQENYNAFRLQYEKTHKLIPILVREYDHKLLRGYEEIVLAKELGITEIPYLEKRYNIARKPKENKTYAIVDCTNRKLYLSGGAHSKFLRCKQMCENWGLSLVIMPLYDTYKVYNSKGQCIWKKDGFTLNNLHKRLKQEAALR